MKYQGRQLALFIFESAMAVFYLLIGVVLLFTNYFSEIFSSTVRIIIGVLFLAYGIFRVYRSFLKMKE